MGCSPWGHRESDTTGRLTSSSTSLKLAESETLGVEVKLTPTSLSGDFGTDSKLKLLFHGA